MSHSVDRDKIYGAQCIPDHVSLPGVSLVAEIFSEKQYVAHKREHSLLTKKNSLLFLFW